MTLPVMTISCSSAVCECQGTSHPDGAFKIIVSPVFQVAGFDGGQQAFHVRLGANFTEASGLISPSDDPRPARLRR